MRRFICNLLPSSGQPDATRTCLDCGGPMSGPKQVTIVSPDLGPESDVEALRWECPWGAVGSGMSDYGCGALRFERPTTAPLSK